MDDTTTTETAPKAKVIRRPSATPKAVKAATKQTAAPKPTKAAPAPKVAKITKPSTPAYSFNTGYAGVSGPLNNRNSRTAIDFSRFGQFKEYPLTERDQKAIEALRRQFGDKPFARNNVDAGILRRLGERGCLVHMKGDETAADATFKLTAKGMGKADARKAA